MTGALTSFTVLGNVPAPRLPCGFGPLCRRIANTWWFFPQTFKIGNPKRRICGPKRPARGDLKFIISTLIDVPHFSLLSCIGRYVTYYWGKLRRGHPPTSAMDMILQMYTDNLLYNLLGHDIQLVFGNADARSNLQICALYLVIPSKCTKFLKPDWYNHTFWCLQTLHYMAGLVVVYVVQ